MTKRVLALVLAVLFALSCTMLVACGTDKTEAPANTPSEGGATPTPSQGEATPTPSQGEPTETPTPEPTPTPDNEPAEKFSTEWLVWLTQEDMGDSGKYPVAYVGGVYMVNYNSETMTASGWEIWPYTAGDPNTLKDDSHFHLCLKINASEFDGYTGLGTDDYAYTWKTYYRVDGTDDPYQMVEGNPWGTCPIGDEMIYRFNLMDYGMKLTLAEDGSTNTYHMIFCIFDEAGELYIWRDELIDWTDSAQQYYEDAVANNVIKTAA